MAGNLSPGIPFPYPASENLRLTSNIQTPRIRKMARISGRTDRAVMTARQNLRQPKSVFYSSGLCWGWTARAPEAENEEGQPLDLSQEIKLPEDTHFSEYADVYSDVWKAGRRKGEQIHKVAVRVLRFRLRRAELENMSALAYAGSEPVALPSCAKRYCREIEIWKNLSHEHIAPLLGTVSGFGPHSSTGMVFPWMDNGTLNSFLEKNDPPVAARFQLLHGIVLGLSYLHNQGIIHGDLNGANIFIDNSMSASIIGFGVSIEDIEFDCTSMAGGSMRWRAPELLSPTMEDSGDFTPVLTSACDIFSFGSITLQILTGKIPYHDISPDICVLLAIVRRTLPLPPLGFNDRYMRFINRCWGNSESCRPDIKTVETELCALRHAALD